MIFHAKIKNDLKKIMLVSGKLDQQYNKMFVSGKSGQQYNKMIVSGKSDKKMTITIKTV